MSFLQKLAKRTKELAEQAAKDAASAYDEIKVSDEQRAERYSICQTCPNFVQLTTTCTKCGCFMAAKTYLSSAECPVGKWGKVIILKQEK